MPPYYRHVIVKFTKIITRPNKDDFHFRDKNFQNKKYKQKNSIIFKFSKQNQYSSIKQV